MIADGAPAVLTESQPAGGKEYRKLCLLPFKNIAWKFDGTLLFPLLYLELSLTVVPLQGELGIVVFKVPSWKEEVWPWPVWLNG